MPVFQSIHESHSLRFARFFIKTESVDKSHLRANYSLMELNFLFFQFNRIFLKSQPLASDFYLLFYLLKAHILYIFIIFRFQKQSLSESVKPHLHYTTGTHSWLLPALPLWHWLPHSSFLLSVALQYH